MNAFIQLLAGIFGVEIENTPHVCGDYNHRFTPRFNSTPPTLDASQMPDDELWEDIIAALTVETYVCDVCTYCGKTVSPAH